MDTTTIIALVFTFIYGLIVGSFLNVVIYRLPRELSLVHPSRSFCPACYVDLTFLSLVPVLGYLVQKGKCKHCKLPISVQYPLIELGSALLSLLVVWQFGLSLEIVFILLFIFACICLLVIDWQLQLLPDLITLPLLWLGLLFNLLGGFVPLTDAVTGAMLGYLVLWGIYWGHKLITKKEGMGYGDFKLTAALCAWFGYQSLIVIMLGSAVLGIIYAVITFKKHQAFAFGPFLIIMGILLLFFPELRSIELLISD